jgi:hypothetical protein
MPSHAKKPTTKAGVQPPTGGTNKRKQPARSVKRVPTVVEVTLPCGLKMTIDLRDDKVLLREHFVAIKKHKTKYEDRLATRTGGEDLHAHPAWKAKVTEAIGEDEASKFMISQYPTYEIFTGFAAGTGFDQVWREAGPPEKFVIVEAKGPGASLSTNAAKGAQMSKEWVGNTLDEIISSPTKSDDEKAAATRMKQAMDSGPPPDVTGEVLTAEPGGGARSMALPPDGGVYHAT